MLRRETTEAELACSEHIKIFFMCSVILPRRKCASQLERSDIGSYRSIPKRF